MDGASSVPGIKSPQGIAYDSAYDILYISTGGTENRIRQIGYPKIYNSQSPMFVDETSFSIAGFGFCDSYCSCNNVQLNQDQPTGVNFTVTVDSCSADTLKISVSPQSPLSNNQFIFNLGPLNATVEVDPLCRCGIGGISPQAIIANLNSSTSKQTQWESEVKTINTSFFF